jgi:hypothetical protein
MPKTNEHQNTDAKPDKIRSGAPDGPGRKHDASHNCREPLELAAHEAVAHFLAAPKSQREFKSFIALAQHFNVTRMTAYRWTQDTDVLWRADWLSLQDKVAGDLNARREWSAIMEKSVRVQGSGSPDPGGAICDR